MYKVPNLRRIRDQATHSAFLGLKRAIQSIQPASESERLIVFVAGVQRSGTNMLMDILEKSIETDVYHESNAQAFSNYEMRNLDTVDSLFKRSRARLFVIKCLCELQDLSSLLESIGPARSIWMVRRYQDVVNSTQRSFPNLATTVHRIAKNRNYDRWIARGMSDKTHALLRNLVHDDMTDASALALFWYFRNILFFEQRLEQDDRVRLLGYEYLVSEPQKTMELISDVVPLKPSPRLTADVFSDSIRKRPDPEIEPAVNEICDELFQRLHRAITNQMQ